MVLTIIVQDDILYLKMNYQYMLQKLPYPIRQPPLFSYQKLNAICFLNESESLLEQRFL